MMVPDIPAEHSGSAWRLRTGGRATGGDSAGRPFRAFLDFVFCLVDRYERHLKEERPDRVRLHDFRCLVEIDGCAGEACDFEPGRGQSRARKETRELARESLNIDNAAAADDTENIHCDGSGNGADSINVARSGVSNR